MLQFLLNNLDWIMPASLYFLGLLTPYLQNRGHRIINSKYYKMAAKAYEAIDPQIIQALGDKVKFIGVIEKVVESSSDGKLSYSEIQAIAKITLQSFDLEKALTSKYVQQNS